ncbi:hypothetical protein K8I61_13435 [bacterium]|nr:hypothetical protein [bacterium]
MIRIFAPFLIVGVALLAVSGVAFAQLPSAGGAPSDVPKPPEKTDSIFPAVTPGKTLADVKAACPDIKIHEGAPDGAKGYSVADTKLAESVRLLFVGDVLALMTYEIPDGKLDAVVAAARQNYGAPAMDGESAYAWKVDKYSLEIAGDPEDGNGQLTFVDPALMKKVGGGADDE